MKRFLARLFQKHSPPPPRSHPPDPDLRDEVGCPPRIDDLFGPVDPTERGHDPGWDYRLWVEDWAEAYLGTAQFGSLQARFASVPGIDAVFHMDREVFLIRSELDAAQIRELLWPQFLEAVKADAPQQ